MNQSEYLTSNTLVSFPFRDGQDIPEQVMSLFVDACVHSDTYDVSMTRVAYDVGTGMLTFSCGTRSYSYRSPENRVGDFDVVSGALSVFVIDRAYLESQPSFDLTVDLAIEPSCIVVDGRSVESIEVDGVRLDSDVMLSCGYNIEARHDDDSEESTIEISAEPGAGLGIVPCQNDGDIDIQTNGSRLLSDDGHVTISGDGCYDMSMSGSTIRINGKCVACCQCDQYVDAVEKLKDSAQDVADIKKIVTSDLVDVYYDTIGKFDTATTYPKIDVQMSIIPDGTIAEIAGSDYFFNTETIPANLSSVGRTAFTIACTVTNICGVPLYVTVPTRWNPGEWSVLGRDSLEGRLDWEHLGGTWTNNPRRLIMNGLQTGYALWNSGTGSFQQGFTIPVIGPDDPDPPYRENRSTGHSQRLTCSMERNTGIGSGSIGKMQPSIDLETYPGYDSRIDMSAGLERAKSLALYDLNSGINRSFSNQNDIRNLSNELLSACCGHQNDVGAYIPPGNSFTITNVYSASVYDVWYAAGIFSTFRARIFAPALLYTIAYNWARPIRKTTYRSNRIEHRTEWGYDPDHPIPGGFGGARPRSLYSTLLYIHWYGETRIIEPLGQAAQIGA